MAAVTPHLLGLPREIRNTIYRYLHQDVELLGSFYINTTSERYREFSVRVRNAPLLGVALTHSQLQDEYKEADCFREPSMILHWGSSHFPLSDGCILAQTSHRMRAILARAKHITVSVMAIQGTDLATLGAELAKVVPTYTQSMRSLRIVFWLTCRFVPHVYLTATLRTPFAASIPDISIALPPVIARLPMSRRGRGFHVGHTFQYAFQEPTPLLSHKVSYITAYYYGSSDDLKHNWSGKDLVEIQRPLPYRFRALSELEEDVAGELVERSSRVLEWKEWAEVADTKGRTLVSRPKLSHEG